MSNVKKTGATTAVPEETANEIFANNKYAHLVRQPSELSMVERLAVNKDLLNIIEEVSGQAEHENSAALVAYVWILEYIRDHYAHDPAVFDKETEGASVMDAVEFANQFRDAVGE